MERLRRTLTELETAKDKILDELEAAINQNGSHSQLIMRLAEVRKEIDNIKRQTAYKEGKCNQL